MYVKDVLMKRMYVKDVLMKRMLLTQIKEHEETHFGADIV